MNTGVALASAEISVCLASWGLARLTDMSPIINEFSLLYMLYEFRALTFSNLESLRALKASNVATGTTCEQKTFSKKKCQHFMIRNVSKYKVF